MKWQGREGSDNVEDRRGISGKHVAIGGGVGTIVIAIIILLLGGDPSQLLNTRGTQVTTGTEQVQTTAEEDSLARFVSVVLKDTETIWGKIFEASGKTYTQPKLVLFRDQIHSACGYASTASGPFYCPGDEKVYIDLSFCQELRTKFGAYGDFAIAYVIAHEVGHHVQDQLGILEKYNGQMSRSNETTANKLSVRIELQADFFAGMWAHYAESMLNTVEAGDIEEALNAAAAVGDDNLEMRYQGRIIPDSFTHGTSAQRKKWFKKGYDTGDFEQGNTFNSTI
jgi:predicted metalloprotease